jgi:hypothetical protein
MASTTLDGVLLKGVAASRPAANAVAKGTIYSATDTGAITQSDGVSTWSTFATISAGFSDPMTTRGDIIVRNASNVTARLGRGSAAQVLTSDGTDVAWSAAGGGGAIVMLEQHTASTSATLDFTTFISSTYDEYLFEAVNIIAATTNVNLLMRMGTGGGPTWDAGTNYGFAGWRWAPAGSAFAGASSGLTGIGLDASGGIKNDALIGIGGTWRLFDPQSALYKRVVGQSGYTDNGGTIIGATVTGFYISTTAVTGIRFLMSSGNIAAGTIRAYGVAK